MQNLITKKLKISLFTTQLEFTNQDEKQADESAAGFVMVKQKHIAAIRNLKCYLQPGGFANSKHSQGYVFFPEAGKKSPRAALSLPCFTWDAWSLGDSTTQPQMPEHNAEWATAGKNV